jgi:hypothetical protein
MTRYVDDGSKGINLPPEEQSYDPFKESAEFNWLLETGRDFAICLSCGHQAEPEDKCTCGQDQP